MSGKKKFVAGVVVGTLLPLFASFPAWAEGTTALSALDRTAIVQALAAKMNANYIEPAVAERVGSAIARKNAEGGYASAASPQAAVIQPACRPITSSMNTRVDVRAIEATS